MRLRSRQAETEDVNQRRLGRGAVSRTAVQPRAIGALEQLPGQPRPIHQKDLGPDLVQELDGRYQAPWAVTLTTGTQAFAAAGTPASWTGEKAGPVTAGFVLTFPTDTLTIEQPGTYRLDLAHTWDTYTGGGSVEILVNGTTIWGPDSETSSAAFVGTFNLGLLARDDEVTVSVAPTAGTEDGTTIASLVLVEPAAPVAPGDIPPFDLLWLDAADLNTAGALSSWSDKSGSGNSVTQGTASRRPSVVLDVINGLPVVRFDGDDDGLGRSTLASSSPQPVTAFLVSRNTATAGTGNVREAVGVLRSDSTRQTEIGIFDDLRWWATSDHRDGSGLALFGPEADTEWHIIEAVFAGANSTLVIDGTVVASGNAGARGFEDGSLYLGAIFVDGWQGDIAEIGYSSGAWTAGERAAKRAELQQKWGIE